MASLAVLRKKAKELGISASVIRGASDADELQSIIEDHSDEKPRKAVAKKKSAVAKKKATRTPARKTNSNKSSAVKSKPAASRKKSGKAKRSTTGTNGYVPKGGRNLLDDVDFTVTDGWNAREKSAPARIIAALKKARGNRERAFEILVPDLWDFVGKKMADGSKRDKQNAHAMLRYRISRTLWDFAMRTGQHDKAENRVEYGTGGTGQGVWKPAKRAKTAPAPARKAKTKTATKARTKSKTATRKTATGRGMTKRKAATVKARGRSKTGSRR